MRFHRLLGSIFAFVAAFLVWSASPALARRIVIDTWGGLGLSGYCSPNECNSFTTPFSVQLGGTGYNTFYANSNGTLSFGSIFSPYLQSQTPLMFDPAGGLAPVPNPFFVDSPPLTDLAAYPVPIFSPNFLDGPGFNNADTLFQGIYDGNFVANTSVTANSFTTSWYTCIRPQSCGLDAVDLIANTSFDPEDVGSPASSFVSYIMQFSTVQCPCTLEERFLSGQQWLVDYFTNDNPMYTMTLTDLGDGFQVDYSYTTQALDQSGIYGFSLPSGAFQATGPFGNRTYLFDSNGNLITGVPEPATWAMMLLGFGFVGFALRRQRKALTGVG
jgi:hypothetical protein